MKNCSENRKENVKKKKPSLAFQGIYGKIKHQARNKNSLAKRNIEFVLNYFNLHAWIMSIVSHMSSLHYSIYW